MKVGSEFFGPTAEAAAKLVDNATKVSGRADNDWALKLDRKAEGQYPIALVAYAIACEEYKDAAKGTQVKSFLKHFASTDVQKGLEEIGYAPLPKEVEDKVLTAIDALS